jgi:hypothetical protein
MKRKKSARHPASPSSGVLWNRLVPATVALLLFAGGIGLAMVWIRQQISETAQASRELQVRTVEIERRIAETNVQIASALSPEQLIRRNRELRLGLVQPREAQIVRVAEEVEVRLAAKRHAEMFATQIVPTSFALGSAAAPATR